MLMTPFLKLQDFFCMMSIWMTFDLKLLAELRLNIFHSSAGFQWAGPNLLHVDEPNLWRIEGRCGFRRLFLFLVVSVYVSAQLLENVSSRALIRSQHKNQTWTNNFKQTHKHNRADHEPLCVFVPPNTHLSDHIHHVKWKQWGYRTGAKSWLIISACAHASVCMFFCVCARLAVGVFVCECTCICAGNWRVKQFQTSFCSKPSLVIHISVGFY